MKKTLYFSLIIYLMGTIFLLCSDFYVSKFFSESDVSTWALLKSILFVCGGICVFGFDQIMMRKPEIVNIVFKKYIFQVVAVSILMAMLVDFFFHNSINVYTVSLIIGLFAINQFWAATFRGDLRLVEAQVFTNGWKVFVLIYLLMGIKSVDLVYVFSLLTVLIINTYFILTIKSKYLGKEYIDEKGLYKLGFFFLLNNLSVTIATYGEQILINLFGDSTVSYDVFTYVLAFNSLMLLFSGFLGFYFGPKFKALKKFNYNMYKKYLIYFFVFSLGLSFLSFIAGAMIFNYYLSKDYNLIVVLFCILVGFIKVMYTIPSVCVALYCSAKQVQKIATFNLFNMMFFILGMYILLVYIPVNKTIGVFIMISVHWFLRLLNTHSNIRNSLRVQNVNS